MHHENLTRRSCQNVIYLFDMRTKLRIDSLITHAQQHKIAVDDGDDLCFSIFLSVKLKYQYFRSSSSGDSQLPSFFPSFTARGARGQGKQEAARVCGITHRHHLPTSLVYVQLGLFRARLSPAPDATKRRVTCSCSPLASSSSSSPEAVLPCSPPNPPIASHTPADHRHWHKLWSLCHWLGEQTRLTFLYNDESPCDFLSSTTHTDGVSSNTYISSKSWYHNLISFTRKLKQQESFTSVARDSDAALFVLLRSCFCVTFSCQ